MSMKNLEDLKKEAANLVAGKLLATGGKSNCEKLLTVLVSMTESSISFLKCSKHDIHHYRVYDSEILFKLD